MSWTRAQQRMVSKLQEIERARKLAAEARVADSRSEAGRARAARDDAARALEGAEAGWAEHLRRGRIDLELGRSVAHELMRGDGELRLCEHGLEAAAEQVDSELERWRLTEARVRSGERALRHGRQALAKRAGAKADQALADRTTWTWFAR